jgi:prephenate dehydrogenase
MKPLKIVIVGLGLIGGSMAKALKQNTSHQVLGMDQDEDALLDACSCGAIDGKAGRDDLKTADLVYLCVYPEGALAFAREYGPLLKAGSVLTDACGVKEELCAAMAALPGQYTFVAGHPMAGKERSGFAASDPSIFVGASYILVDTGAPDWAMVLVRERAEEMGFGRVVRTTPARHDQMIAFTSQLPHALACAYVMSPRCPEHQGFSAGSYRDVSRVANINDALWSRLFLDNQKALTQELDQLIANLSRLRDAVDRRDQEELRSLLRTAAQIKRQVG